MFKRKTLLTALKKHQSTLSYLPDGLYTPENEKIRYSGLLLERLRTQFGHGAVLVVRKEAIRTWTADENRLFAEILIKSGHAFETVPGTALSVEIVMREIAAFAYSRSKNPYENLLEAAVIRSLIDGLILGNSLIGGLWDTRGVREITYHQETSRHSALLKSSQVKNHLLLELRKKLEQYPENLIYITAALALTGFNLHHSQYATFLEYRLLQIQFKNALQELCLMFQCMGAEDKQRCDDKVSRFKVLLATYPAKLV